MTLPRPILLRIRRKLRRQLAMNPFSPCLTAADSQAKRQRNRRRAPRRALHRLIFLLIATALVFALGLLTGCTQTRTVTTDPLTGAVTETITKAPTPGVLPFAAAAIVAYSPRPIVIREAKSTGPHSTRRFLHPWHAPRRLCHPAAPAKR